MIYDTAISAVTYIMMNTSTYGMIYDTAISAVTYIMMNTSTCGQTSVIHWRTTDRSERHITTIKFHLLTIEYLNK